MSQTVSDTGSNVGAPPPLMPPPQPTEPAPDDHTGRRVLLNTGALAGSSLWRIVISFVLQVLITRVLGVAQLGQYISALAFLNVAQVVSELGLPNLLVRDLAQSPHQRRAYFTLALRIQLISALLTWLGLIALSFILPLSPGLRIALRLAGASLPFYAVTSTSQMLFQASERMELVMSVEGLINTLIIALSIFVLLFGGQVQHLIGVVVVSQAASAALCLFLVARNHLLRGADEPVNVGWTELWRDARPFYGLSLADVLLHRMDILLLNVVGGDLLIGIYSIAYSLVRVVVKLIQSYWKALYPTFSRLRLNAPIQYQQLAALGLRYGLMIVLPGAALAVGSAAPILSLLYGERALASVTAFQVLIWMTPFFLVETFAITLLMADRTPRLSLLLTGMHIVGVAILLPPLTVRDGAAGAAWAMVMASILGAIGGLYVLHRQRIPVRVDKLWAMVLAAAVAGATNIWLPIIWPLRLVLSALFYVALVWLTGAFASTDRQLLRRALGTQRGTEHG